MATPKSSTPTLRPSAAWPSRFEWGLIFAFWTLIAVFTVVTRLLDPRGGNVENAVLAARAGQILAEYFLWALATPFIFWLAGRYEPRQSQLTQAILAHLAASLLVALAVDLATDLLRAYVFPAASRHPAVFRPLQAIVRLWFIDELVIYGAILATGFARIYYLRERLRQQEAERLARETRELEAQKSELEAQLSAARLEALRMQLNPHFLFNTLHAVSTLVGRDPKGVRRMIARLSTLLRYVLEENGRQESPLSEEIDFLRGYLEIQEIRFQGRLDVEMEIAPGVESALVPSLILQPIVENAMKHGTSEQTGLGRVAVRAYREEDELVLEVADSGPGLDEPASTAMERGMGLTNVRARLDGLYGDAHTLSFHTSTFGGLTVTIRIPYHETGDLYTPSADDEDVALADLPPHSRPASS